MQSTIDALIARGTRLTDDPVEQRHIKLTNMIALVVLAWFVPMHLPPLLVLPWGVLPLLAGTAMAAVLIATVRLNTRGEFALARLVIVAGGTVYNAFNTVLLGAESWNHLYLIGVAMVALMVFPPREARVKWSFVAICLVGVILFQLGPQEALVRRPYSATFMRVFSLFGLFTWVGLLQLYASKVIHDTEAALAVEKKRADDLLHNMLPEPIVRRLKAGERTIADDCDEVSILFADLVGFTVLAQTLPPKELVELLNEIFSRFDELATQLGIEKIKTIGDAYMAVVGIPKPRADHAVVMARMAFGMRDAIKEIADQRSHELEIRIGIHSGPVVAGVIGQSKLAYDLWGDTVNTAARMESHGVPGEIQVTEAVVDRLEGFTAEPRGTIEVKGKGQMKTWFLRS